MQIEINDLQIFLWWRAKVMKYLHVPCVQEMRHIQQGKKGKNAFPITPIICYQRNYKYENQWLIWPSTYGLLHNILQIAGLPDQPNPTFEASNPFFQLQTDFHLLLISLVLCELLLSVYAIPVDAIASARSDTKILLTPFEKQVRLAILNMSHTRWRHRVCKVRGEQRNIWSMNYTFGCPRIHQRWWWK